MFEGITCDTVPMAPAFAATIGWMMSLPKKNHKQFQKYLLNGFQGKVSF